MPWYTIIIRSHFFISCFPQDYILALAGFAHYSWLAFPNEHWIKRNILGTVTAIRTFTWNVLTDCWKLFEPHRSLILSNVSSKFKLLRVNSFSFFFHLQCELIKNDAAICNILKIWTKILYLKSESHQILLSSTYLKDYFSQSDSPDSEFSS